MSITNSRSLPKLMSIESVMPSNHLMLCRPLLLPASGSFQMSQLFASGGQSIGASASSSVLPMNIQVDFFRIDWFDLLAVQGTLKSLFQHHSSKASILLCSAFFMVHLSHPNMTTRKAIALTKQILACKQCPCFLYAVQVCHSFPSYEQVYFNFKAAVTVCSDFYSPRK